MQCRGACLCLLLWVTRACRPAFSTCHSGPWHFQLCEWSAREECAGGAQSPGGKGRWGSQSPRGASQFPVGELVFLASLCFHADIHAPNSYPPACWAPASEFVQKFPGWFRGTGEAEQPWAGPVISLQVRLADSCTLVRIPPPPTPAGLTRPRAQVGVVPGGPCPLGIGPSEAAAPRPQAPVRVGPPSLHCWLPEA